MIRDIRYNALNSSLEPITAYFIADMDIMGHKFIIRCNRELDPITQKSWFDSIMEVLVANGLQISK